MKQGIGIVIAAIALAAAASGGAAQRRVDRGVTFPLEQVTGVQRAMLTADGSGYVCTRQAPNFTYSIVHYQRATGVVTTLSVDRLGRPVSTLGFSYPDLSDTARHVVFASVRDDLVTLDKNRQVDIFRFDRATRRNERVSVVPAGTHGANSGSYAPFVSGTGRYVVFESTATDLVPTDPNGRLTDVYVRDMVTKRTTRMGTATPTDYTTDGHIIGETHLCYLLYPGPNLPARVMRYDIAHNTHTTLTTVWATHEPKIGRSGSTVAWVNWRTQRIERWDNGVVTIGPETIDMRIELSPNGRYVSYKVFAPTPGQATRIWDIRTGAILSASATIDGRELPHQFGYFGKCDTMFAYDDNVLRACYVDFGIAYPPTVHVGASARFAIVSDPSYAGKRYRLAHALAFTPGIPIPGDAMRSVPLAPDALLLLSTSGAPMFTGYAGTLDNRGSGAATLAVPTASTLVGLGFYTAGVAFDVFGVVGLTGARRTTIAP